MNQTVEEQVEIKENEDVEFEVTALHLTNLAVVPGVNVTCDINNPEEALQLQDIFNNQEKIALVTSKTEILNPKAEDIYEYGCLAKVEKVNSFKNGTLKAGLQGVERIQVTSILGMRPIKIRAKILKELNTDSAIAFQKMNEIRRKYRDASKFEHYLPPELENQILFSPMKPNQFADSLIHIFTKDVKEQQKLLSELDVEKRLDVIDNLLDKFLGNIIWKKEIDEKVNANLSKNQKEMFLREQLKVINDELNGEIDEIEEFKDKVKKLGLDKDREAKVLKEIKKLSKLPFGSPEVGYIRNFIETVLELPWTERTEDNLDLEQAKKVLDQDHYALDKVKQRILESLSVMKLTGKVSGQILCLAGPPGVGKTSIARSIAKAMGRNFVQVALGGVSDESVIRGHRRTYVGAMCGRILAGMKQAKTINPVFLLDEIDKLTKDIKGDPSSALLEVLDSEQNDHFKDNFLEMPYDLSQVLFILTANSLSSIPKPLLDRMEVIELRSYTEVEKIQIAQRHLIAKQEKLCGLKKGAVPFTKEILSAIINDYTYEAGVRNLERAIAGVCRKYASFEAGAKKNEDISVNNLPDFLGNDFSHQLKVYQGGNVGEVVGMFDTNPEIRGGTLLVEALVIPGDEKITLTGQLGPMAQESARTAYSLIKSMAQELNVDSSKFSNCGLHIHIPILGGVEGPSAGIATATAIASAFTNKKVKESLAMTGEVSLRGRVLPVGGIRNKLIGAHKVGIRTIIMPKDNERDLADLPQEIRKDLTIHFVTNIKEVFDIALEK